MSMLTPRLTAETFSFAPVQIAASSWTARVVVHRRRHHQAQASPTTHEARAAISAL